MSNASQNKIANRFHKCHEYTEDTEPICRFCVKDGYEWSVHPRNCVQPIESLQRYQQCDLVSSVVKLLCEGNFRKPKYLNTSDLLISRSVSVVNFGAQGLGRAASFLPELNSAVRGARSIYRTIDRPTKLDVNVGETPSCVKLPEIKFSNAQFAFPTRAKAKVLKVNLPRRVCLICRHLLNHMLLVALQFS